MRLHDSVTRGYSHLKGRDVLAFMTFHSSDAENWLFLSSYLGSGIMAARLSTLGALSTDGRTLPPVFVRIRRSGTWPDSRLCSQSWNGAFSGAPACPVSSGVNGASEGWPTKWAEIRTVRSSESVRFLRKKKNFIKAVPPSGQEGYKPCYQEVLKVVKGIIHQPDQLENSNAFYAFSYYFDRAVDAGLIG